MPPIMSWATPVVILQNFHSGFAELTRIVGVVDSAAHDSRIYCIRVAHTNFKIHHAVSTYTLANTLNLPEHPEKNRKDDHSGVHLLAPKLISPTLNSYSADFMREKMFAEGERTKDLNLSLPVIESRLSFPCSPNTLANLCIL